MCSAILRLRALTREQRAAQASLLSSSSVLVLLVHAGTAALHQSVASGGLRLGAPLRGRRGIAVAGGVAQEEGDARVGGPGALLPRRARVDLLLELLLRRLLLAGRHADAGVGGMGRGSGGDGLRSLALGAGAGGRGAVRGGGGAVHGRGGGSLGSWSGGLGGAGLLRDLLRQGSRLLGGVALSSRGLALRSGGLCGRLELRGWSALLGGRRTALGNGGGIVTGGFLGSSTAFFDEERLSDNARLLIRQAGKQSERIGMVITLGNARTHGEASRATGLRIVVHLAN